MLVLHPSSTCDVCLDPYNEEKLPHTITCGHSFCLRCLQLLTRQCCPLCRKPFVPEEVRRLHTIKDGRAVTPPLPEANPSVESSSHAQRLLRRITRIVCEGALASEVRDLIEEVHSWLSTQPHDEHADLRSAHLLLFRFTEQQRKSAEDKHAYADLQQACQNLKDQQRVQEEAAEVKYQELDRLRNEELEVAKAMKESLQARYEKLDKDWSGKYEVCVAECRRLLQELQELKRSYNPLPQPPRPAESRYYYLMERSSINPDPVLVLKDDSLDSTTSLKVQIAGKEEMFRLSPVPSTLPIPPMSTTFRALTDDMDDRDNDAYTPEKGGNDPYFARPAQPIPIKSSIQRIPSGASLLTRHDPSLSRSIPRSSVDIHMASCSSSPNVSVLPPAARDRFNDGISSSPSAHQEGALGLRLSGSRRSSIGSQGDPRDHEEQRERWRAQLRDVLNDPVPQTQVTADVGQTHVPNSASLGSYSASDGAPAPVVPPLPATPGNRVARSNTISRASTAAIAAERARASASTKNSSLSPTSPSTPTMQDRHVVSPPSHSSLLQQTRPPYSRMVSTESLRGTAAMSTASGLTRTLWQEQRV